MGIRFSCPNGHKLNVKEFLAGKRGVCPQCGAKFIIPAPSETKMSAPPGPGAASQSYTIEVVPPAADLATDAVSPPPNIAIAANSDVVVSELPPAKVVGDSSGVNTTELPPLPATGAPGLIKVVNPIEMQSAIPYPSRRERSRRNQVAVSVVLLTLVILLAIVLIAVLKRDGGPPPKAKESALSVPIERIQQITTT